MSPLPKDLIPTNISVPTDLTHKCNYCNNTFTFKEKVPTCPCCGASDYTVLDNPSYHSVESMYDEIQDESGRFLTFGRGVKVTKIYDR